MSKADSTDRGHAGRGAPICGTSRAGLARCRLILIHQHVESAGRTKPAAVSAAPTAVIETAGSATALVGAKTTVPKSSKPPAARDTSTCPMILPSANSNHETRSPTVWRDVPKAGVVSTPGFPDNSTNTTALTIIVSVWVSCRHDRGQIHAAVGGQTSLRTQPPRKAKTSSFGRVAPADWSQRALMG